MNHIKQFDSQKNKIKNKINWQDPLLLQQQLDEEEILIQQTAKRFADEYLLNRVIDDFQNENETSEVIKEMGKIGLLGINLPQKYGGSEASYVSYGLVAREIEKIDSGYRSMMSVQNSLVIYPILQYGSQHQKDTYLTRLAKGEIIGCFALTESNAGSDPSSLTTKAKKTQNGYVINGAKSWISNAPIADIFIIWAKLQDEDNQIRGFIVEKNNEGIKTKTIKNKLSLRTSVTGEIFLQDLEVSTNAILPEAKGMKAPFSCLNFARYGIAWGAIGAAESCWFAAREYGMQRIQFKRPIAQNQLFQKKLADMMTEITIALQTNLRVGRMMQDNQIIPEVISMIKRNNCAKALEIARDARDMHGANGIQQQYHVIRHLLNLETVNTYEGTYDIHTLILGKAQTGLQAFY